MQARIPNISGGSQHIGNLYPEPPNVGRVSYLGQLERSECSELLREVTSQTDGRKPVVRGLLLLYTELFDPCL